MRDLLTTRSTPNEAEDFSRRCVAVRLLAHPNSERVGEFCPLFDFGGEGTALISRNTPEFRTMEGRVSGPLLSPRITRTPLSIELRADRVVVSSPPGSARIEVNGEPLRGERALDLAAMDSGIVILFGSSLALLVGNLELTDAATAAPSMIGDSTALRVLRQEIARIAELDVPVLLRGETGVGKELVAAALHSRSLRSAAPYIAVNLASVPPSLAASELFGHRRGAFSGATDDHKGYFSQADGGTLFLDEIGDIGSDVQTSLLRAIESGVIQPLGGKTTKVDVRLIAATDSNLEEAISKQQFREPLLRRFSYEIRIPPLRARRDDIGLLFIHFIRQRLGAALAMERLNPPGPDPDPWIPAAFVADLALHDWPGNVRELANVALRFAVENRERKVARVSDSLKELLRPRARADRNPAPQPSRPRRSPLPSDAELIAAMKSANFQRERAAKALGISKSYLSKRLESIPQIRSVAEIPAPEVRAALELANGDLESAAAALQVSERALKLYVKRTGRQSDH